MLFFRDKSPFLLLTAFFMFLGDIQISSAQVCGNQLTVTPSSVQASVVAGCINLANNKKKARHITEALNKLKRSKSALGATVWKSIRNHLNDLKSVNCKPNKVAAIDCNSATSAELSEVFLNIEASSCDLRYMEDRQARLKKHRRALKKIRPYTSSEFTLSVVGKINQLLRSKKCGKGGSELMNHCSAIYETEDGIGKNVYKLLEYFPHLPIFVSRDPAQSCRARSGSGKVIEELRYTGLANPDDAGLRHHYRFSRTCTNYPELFYIECQGRCYEINDRCGRID